MRFLCFIPALFAVSIGRADIVIVQKVEGPGQSGEMTIKLRGDKMRVDVAQQMSVIRDAKSGESVTLMHAQKSYLRLTRAASEALRQRVMENAELQSDTSAKLRPTGRKEKINGFDTEEYTSETGTINVRYWIARNFPHWNVILQQMLRMRENGLDQLMKGRGSNPADFPGMPVRTETILEGQKVTTTVLSVKEQPLSDAEFELPPGYAELLAPAFESKGTPPSE